MRRKRSRAADERARRHKSAKRQIKHRHRFVQFEDKDGGGHWYEDIKTGKSYPGEMPKVLRAFRLTEVTDATG